MKVSLPESIRPFVEKRVAEGKFSAAREYVVDLIRADMRRQHERRIDELLLEGLASGKPFEADEAYWEGKRECLVTRLRHEQVL
jgi:antitoxin ParD1/3/4